MPPFSLKKSRILSGSSWPNSMNLYGESDTMESFRRDSRLALTCLVSVLIGISSIRLASTPYVIHGLVLGQLQGFLIYALWNRQMINEEDISVEVLFFVEDLVK